MEEALVAYLLAFAGLTGLVSTRVHWTGRPQASALPAVVLHRIGGAPVYSMSGGSGLHMTRVQVDCWGSTYASAKAVSRQVFTRLSGARFTSSGVVFQAAFAEGEDDSREQAPGGTDLFRVSQDYLIWHGEA